MDHVFVLYDRASNTVWYPGETSLEGVGGERRGEQLPFLDEPAPVVLAEWLAEHPDSTVLLPSEEDYRDLNRPLLGVRGLEEQDGGLLIESTVENGPAGSAGVLAGDVLIRFGDVATDTRKALSEAMDVYAPGDEVEVVVKRGEKEVTVAVMLGHRE
jgi:predicted metalloprotease with PDZ domain